MTSLSFPRAWHAAALSLTLVSLFSACRSQDQVSGGALTVGVIQHGSAIPIIVAQNEHLFEKHGLTVVLKNLTPAQHMPALLRGDVQALSPSTFPVIFSTAQQNPHEIMGYMTGGEATDGDVLYGIVVPKSSQVTSLRELVGKTIGTASKFVVVNLRNVLGAKLGDHDGTTSIREIADQGALLEALRRGTVDAVVLDQPALSSREVFQEFKVIEPNFRATYLGSPYWSGSGVARRDWTFAHKEQFEAYLAALDEALALCKQDPSRAKNAFISYFELRDLEPERIGMYVYPGARFAPPPAFVQELAEMLVTNGMLSPGFDAAGLFYQ